ncbi:uncharacterized protein LOC133335698, partial [Musca vetustissima]|uniref:uncharacterized protein LOC133335698 n=1 Tax=Musca vetustissima TaxID=27455 RepID=UPI002AB6C21A
VCQQPDKWTVSHYHEDKHNCYTFVLTFLQALMYEKLSEATSSKTTFCEKYIVPRTTTAGKYISLYRKFRDTGIYVHHTNLNKLRYDSASSGAGGSGNSRSKMGKQDQQHYQQQEHKFNNPGITTSNQNNDGNKEFHAFFIEIPNATAAAAIPPSTISESESNSPTATATTTTPSS